MPANSMSDIVPLLVPKPDTLGLRFGQGIIRQWNPSTFENIVEWRGVALENVPVLASVEALSFELGDSVGMLGWAPEGGASSWWILGRISVPGQDVRDFVFAGSLVVRDFIVAESMRSRETENGTNETFSSTTFVAPANGASHTFVAPPSGVVRVDVSAELTAEYTSSASIARCFAAFQIRKGHSNISGQISYAASINDSVIVGIEGTASGERVTGAATRTKLVTNLDPGVMYSIEYQHRVAGTGVFNDSHRVIMTTPQM